MTTDTTVDIGTLIVPHPASRHPRPVMAGSRLTVHTIAGRYLRGDTPEEMLESWPYLDVSRIYAALAYYFANRAQLDAELDADEAWIDRMARRFPNGWSTEYLADDELP